MTSVANFTIMKRPDSSKLPRPTESELELLNILWAMGKASVRHVHDALTQDPDRKVGYTTVLKLLQIMHEKGLVTREKHGKLHLYEPALSQASTQQQLLGRLLETAFSGSAKQLVMQALGNSQTSVEELEELKAYIEQLENKEGKS